MTKGIRAFVNDTFVKTLPQLPELGGTEFRRAILTATIEQFGTTVASAATHYNHAFKMVKAERPDLVMGLGRAEDKKGGRPVVHPVTVINARSGKVMAEGISRAAATDMIKAAGILKNGEYRLAIKADELQAA